MRFINPHGMLLTLALVALALFLFYGCATQVTPTNTVVYSPTSSSPGPTAPVTKQSHSIYVEGTKCTEIDADNIKSFKLFQDVYNTAADQLAKDEIRDAPVNKNKEDKVNYNIALLQYKKNVQEDVNYLNKVSEMMDRFKNKVSKKCLDWLNAGKH